MQPHFLAVELAASCKCGYDARRTQAVSRLRPQFVRLPTKDERCRLVERRRHVKRRDRDRTIAIGRRRHFRRAGDRLAQKSSLRAPSAAYSTVISNW